MALQPELTPPKMLPCRRRVEPSSRYGAESENAPARGPLRDDDYDLGHLRDDATPRLPLRWRERRAQLVRPATACSPGVDPVPLHFCPLLVLPVCPF